MTRLGTAAIICLALLVGSVATTPVFALESDTPAIERSPMDTGDSWNVSEMGRFAEGPAFAVDVRNDTTYSGNGAVFEIVDFSNSLPPALLGRVTLPSVIYGVKVVGDYAYVANHEDGLQIIDISDPTNPTVVGTYEVPGYSVELDVVGGTAYVANSWSGLRLIDVSTPSSPTEISHYQISGQTLDVEVVGDYAYAAASTYGIFIIDISNPALPTEVGSYDTSGNYYKIDVEGNYAFLAANTYDLEVVNIANPYDPFKVLHYSVDGLAASVCVEGNYAYVGSNGIHVIDIMNPESPNELGLLAQSPVSVDIAVSGTRAYIASDYAGVVAYNVAAAASPSIVATHDSGDKTTGIIAIEGVEMAEPSPAAGDYIFIAHGTDGIQAVEVTDPANPVKLGKYTPPAGPRVEDVAISTNRLCTAWTDGFRVVNIGNPSAPVLMGYYDTNQSVGVAAHGDYAYVASRGYGLYVIDISDPSNPVEAGRYDTTGQAWDVVYSGGYAYVADYNSGLTIVDVSTPSTPTQVGTYEVPKSVYTVAVTGDYAYVGSFSNGVYVVDVSTPSAPVEIANIYPGGNIRNLFISGNYLYIARSIFGLDVYYINDKLNSPKVGEFDTGDEAYDVFVLGNRVYLADFRAGAWMLEFNPPPTPTFITGFFCEPVADGVELSWQILSDDVIRGFNVYRSEGGDVARIINTGGIIPPGAGRFVDTSARAGESYEYRLAVVLDDGSEVMSIPQTVTIAGIELILEPNYPNPFNPSTTISFVLPTSGHVTVSVYSADGKLIRTIVDGPMSEGQKTYMWDGKDAKGNPVVSGIYFCRLKTEDRTLTRKMTLVK